MDTKTNLPWAGLAAIIRARLRALMEDHAAMIDYWNGHYLSHDQIHVSPDDRGFLLADGAYEVIRAYRGRFFRLDAHLERLARSLRELGIGGLDVASLGEVAERLIRDNGLTHGDATVYMQVTRGAGPRSRPFPDPPISPTVYATASVFAPLTEEQQTGIRIALLPDIRWARCDIKSISLLPTVLAGQRAREMGVEEAVFVRDGAVTEGTHTNFAAVIDGTLLTAPRSPYVLAGITRQAVLDLCRELGIPSDEFPILEPWLARAQECMVLSTFLEVMPVVEIDGRPVGDGRPGPITRRLQIAFDGRTSRLPR
jgi:D-alanine transaminase